MKTSYAATARAQNSDVLQAVDDSEMTYAALARGLRVVVLDDDQVFLKVVERYARQLGVNVTTTATVTALAEALTNQDYDAIVIDYYLDNDTGNDVADSLFGVPIVLTSRKSDWTKGQPELSPRISAFVHKKYGAKIVLQKAVDLAIRSKLGAA